jgi:hypothetical protein
MCPSGVWPVTRPWSISRGEFRAVAENSFKASFLDEDAMNRMLEELKSYLGM